MAYTLTVERDRLEVTDTSGSAVATANISPSGCIGGIDMPDHIRKSNRARLAALRCMGGNDEDGAIIRARAYYANEQRAGIEMSNGGTVDPSCFPLWARSVLDRHFPGWSVADSFGKLTPVL